MMVHTAGPNFDQWTPSEQARDVARLLARTGQYFYARKMYLHMSTPSHQLEVDVAILATFRRQVAQSERTPATVYTALYREKDLELGLDRSSSSYTNSW
jgi:ferritin